MADPRYPVGKFDPPEVVTPQLRSEMIRQIEEAPHAMRAAVRGLSPSQLVTPYRDGGWTLRQVVHHVPDSHMNAYIRFKLGMTEDQPTIKTYDEARWALLPEASGGDVAMSLDLLEALHRRWVSFLRDLSERDFARTLVHPDSGVVTLDWLLAMYSWHGRHHVAHITTTRERLGM